MLTSLRPMRLFTLACLAALLSAPPSYAGDGEIEEILVTGSFIKRTDQADAVSPITNIDRSSIDDSGILTSQEIFRWLPSNTGSENQADSLTQGGTTGTANVNLRGLGLGSTLILVNGRRQTVASQVANGGDTFVDINSLMPFIMVENIEVLKDGAAALYGSDAVAGVVNYKTRSDFEGFELRANYQATSQSDSHEDRDISALFGAGTDRTHVSVALQYFERDELPITERDNLPRKTESGFGNPGSYVLLGPSPTFPDAPFGGGTQVADPNCEDGTGSRLQVDSPTRSTCRFDFGPSFTLVPDEKRLAAYAVANFDVNENHTLFSEFGYAKNEALAGFSPSFPAFNFPVISPTHPGNPFGVPAVAVYRPLGDGTGEPGGSRVENTVVSETVRFVFGANGEFGGSGWGYDFAYTFSENETLVTGNDQVSSRLNLALAGLGGTGCNVLANTPGQNGCLYFNPFGNSLTAQPGDPTFNTPEVLAFINSNNPTATEVDLVTWDLVFSGNLFEMPGGTAGLAFGAQRREEKRVTDRSEDAEREDLAFLVGGPDVRGESEVDAFFAELFLPFFASGESSLEAQVAIRYEDYDSGFDSTDPKIGLLYRYGDRFSARFTWGTAFRAPTLFQQNNEVTSLNASFDPLTGSLVFIGNTASPNPDLLPEDAETFNIGATWSPIDNLQFSLDYYNVQYDDRLVQESGQDLLIAESVALGGAGCTPATITEPQCVAVRNPNILRNPNSGAPTRIFVNRFNAASAETDGFDFEARWNFDTDFGTFGITNNTTYVASFEVQQVEGGPTVDGAGFRNESNILARSIPEIRSNTVFSWSNNSNQLANVIVRYIDEYEEDAGGSIDDWTVVDLQYNYTFTVFGDNEATLTVGALNVFDEDPPEVAGNLNEFGYDTKVHDPRGRMWYLRAVYNIP
ncbi:MAG: TonB-dependent receptor [Pseudomonadota bacterium]